MRLWPVLFGLAAALPFVETLVFWAHVGPGKRLLSVSEYVMLAGMVAILLGLMVVGFLLEGHHFRRVRTRLSGMAKKLRSRAMALLYILPVLFLALFFGGNEAFLFVFNLVLKPVLLPAFLAIGAASLVWLIAWLIGTSTGTYENLKDALDGWSLGMRASTLFYVILVAATWKLVSLEGIREAERWRFLFAVGKDYLLIFIISDMLFLGLYRIAFARQLIAVFQGVRGFLNFVLICGLIAILAIWADFNALDPANLRQVYKYDWQIDYNVVHTYLRDIGLLLMPIAGLLFWCVWHVGIEQKEASVRPRTEKTGATGPRP